MTLYEKITQMSVDEMADVVLREVDAEKFCHSSGDCEKMLDKEQEIPRDLCLACARQWLESEVNEDDEF